MSYERQERTNDGIEINIFAFLRVITSKIWIVLVFAIVFGIIGAAASSIFHKDTYSCKVSFVVNTLTNDSEKVENSDISASINVTATYQYILEGRSVIAATAEKCAVPVNYEQVKDALSVNIISGSNVIEAIIKTSDPRTSYEISKSLVENYNKIVSEIYSNAHLNICDYPVQPSAADDNSTTLILTAIGVIFGIIVGIVAILIYYIVHDTIRSVDDIPRKLNINVLGSINKITGKTKGLLVTNKKIGFAFIETFKAIRTKVEGNAAKEDNKVYMVTSACENEGKTTISSNLAITLAQNGKSVLLIDSDLRKPAVCKMLGIEHSGRGLGSVITGKTPLENAIKYIDKHGIFVIADSHSTENPSELLSTKRMADIIKAVRTEFDFIIIDTAPASVVTDASVISSLADATILVISEDKAPVGRIKMSINDIDSNGAEVIGCVYNNTSVSKKRYGGGYYGSYGYGYGYGYGSYGYGYGYGDKSESNKIDVE